MNAALFAAVAVTTGRTALAVAGFVALTTVLSVNYNSERLYRAERGEDEPRCPRRPGARPAFFVSLYALVYAPQDRLVERFVAQRLRGAGPQERLAYHDRATVSVLANLRDVDAAARLRDLHRARPPAAFAWVALAELVLVLLLALRRDLVIRDSSQLKEESA